MEMLYFLYELNIVESNSFLLHFLSSFFMFDFSLIPLAHAATSAIDPSQAYELDDIIRVGIALVVLVSGFLSVIFILW